MHLRPVGPPPRLVQIPGRIPSTAAKCSVGRSVAEILEDLLDRTVAALDGGQGFGILGVRHPS